jgi:hypothetical protein
MDRNLPEIKPLEDLKLAGIRLLNTSAKALPPMGGIESGTEARKLAAEEYAQDMKAAFYHTKQARAKEKARKRIEERMTEEYAKNLGKR